MFFMDYLELIINHKNDVKTLSICINFDNSKKRSIHFFKAHLIWYMEKFQISLINC